VEPDLVATLTQFGTAGLIAWMWLTERRHAGERERELSEAHAEVKRSVVQVQQLLSVVSGNTRALSALEASQRGLTRLLERLGQRLGERASERAGEERA